MHTPSIQIKYGENNSERSYRKWKDTVKTMSHNCCSFIADFSCLNYGWREIYRASQLFMYKKHRQRCFKSIRIPSFLFSINFTRSEMKKSQAKQGKKSQEYLSLLIFGIRALTHVHNRLHTTHISSYRWTINSILLGHLYDAYKVFLVLPCLSSHMSSQRGKIGATKAVGVSDGNVSSLWSSNV